MNWSFHLLVVDASGKGKSSSVKKRTLKEEHAFFQTKKIKQEEGCTSSEIMELKEKVAKLEAILSEQQQKFWLLEQRLDKGLPPDIIPVILPQMQLKTNVRKFVHLHIPGIKCVLFYISLARSLWLVLYLQCVVKNIY